MRRLVAALSVLSAATVLLSGCVAGPDPVQGQFEGREPFESCGSLALDAGDVVPANAWDCLEDGVSTGAEFVVALPETESGATRYVFRTGPELAGVELFIDATADQWGKGKWDRRLCTGDDFRTVVAGCLAVFVPVEG